MILRLLQKTLKRTLIKATYSCHKEYLTTRRTNFVKYLAYFVFPWNFPWVIGHVVLKVKGQRNEHNISDV